MKTKLLQKITNEFFSSEKVISYYAKPKLHLYEKRLFGKLIKKKKAKILDLCCGAGRVSIPLAKAGHNIIGIDINSKMIKIAKSMAKKKNIRNVKFFCLDAEKMGFEKEIFDYVIMMETSLENISGKKKREKIFKKINKYIKPDGLLIFSIHPYFYPLKFFLTIQKENVLNILFRRFELNDCIMDADDGKVYYGKCYFHIFTPIEIYRLLKRTGFSKISIIPFNTLDERKNKFKNTRIYNFIWPLVCQFWVAKK